MHILYRIERRGESAIKVMRIEHCADGRAFVAEDTVPSWRRFAMHCTSWRTLTRRGLERTAAEFREEHNLEAI